MVVKILVVDDHPEQLEVIKKVLETSSHYLPFNVLTASNGDDALKLYNAHSEMELAILDTVLDAGGTFGERGWEVYDRLRAAGYAGPVIARSSSDPDKGWGDKRARYSISKSIPLPELEATVSECVALGYKIVKLETPETIGETNTGCEILINSVGGGIVHGTLHGYQKHDALGTIHLRDCIYVPLSFDLSHLEQQEKETIGRTIIPRALAYLRRNDTLVPRSSTHIPQTMYGFGNQFHVYKVTKW